MGAMLKGRKVLITGGAGFLGRALVSRILPMNPREIVVASRDEVKHANMRQAFPDVIYIVADVRDQQRIRRATHGVDVIIHAAAMKRVESCAFDPQEAIKTNVVGSQNVVEAALDNEVPIVIGISSDKACNPLNLYGSTKATMEKLFLSANSYNLGGVPRFSVVRYPNVLGSTGSVIPLFLQQKKTGVIPITHMEMTRFVITADDAVNLILNTIEAEQPGLYMPPDLAAMRIVDMARIIAPDAELRLVGTRPGEKLYEVMWENDDGTFCASNFPPRWFQEKELVAWLDKQYPGWSQ